ncbi:hypothetical protein SeGA_1113, partial [Salmonella enterica subsp. enterica serovar Gaminara str. A4-567]
CSGCTSCAPIVADRSDGVAQLRQDEAFIKGGKTFVRINCEHFE